MIGWGHRVRLEGLARRHGARVARAILEEARRSLDFTRALIDRLPGDVRHRRTGRYLGAASPRHFERLAVWARDEAPGLGMAVEIVPAAEQDRHIATETYCGGLLFPEHGLLHPGLFHAALLAAARAAGAAVIDHCPVTSIAGGPGAWRIVHGRGETRAREIVHAANGYSGGARGPVPALGRRLVPVPSFLIATERLGANRVAGLIPQGQAIVDTRATHSYFRPDPEGTRILWGGRAALSDLPPLRAAARLRDHMLSVFPDLAGARITHSWTGRVAFTRDGVAHVGQLGGVWHAGGYNGSGVAMAPYLGWRVAQKLLGRPEGATGFDEARFEVPPLRAASPLLLRGLDLWLRARDRFEGVRRIGRS